MPRKLPEVLLTPKQRGLLARTKRLKASSNELSEFSKARGPAGDVVVNVQGRALANALKIQSGDLAREAEVLAARSRKRGTTQLPLKIKKAAPKKMLPYLPRHGRIPLRTVPKGVRKAPRKIIVVRRAQPKK